MRFSIGEMGLWQHKYWLWRIIETHQIWFFFPLLSAAPWHFWPPPNTTQPICRAVKRFSRCQAELAWNTMKDPSAQPRYLSHKLALRHSLQTSSMAFPAFPTDLVPFRDGYRAVPWHFQRGDFSPFSLELAQIEVVPSVGFALPSCPWLSHAKGSRRVYWFIMDH